MFAAASRRAGQGGLDQLEDRAGGQVQEDVELLLEVGKLHVDLLESLPRLQERRPGLDGAKLGKLLRPGIPLDDAGADPLGGQESPVELLHAAEKLARPLFELGLGNMLV